MQDSLVGSDPTVGAQKHMNPGGCRATGVDRPTAVGQPAPGEKRGETGPVTDGVARGVRNDQCVTIKTSMVANNKQPI